MGLLTPRGTVPLLPFTGDRREKVAFALSSSELSVVVKDPPYLPVLEWSGCHGS